VRNASNNLGEWENAFDGAVVGKSQADLVTESAISDSYNAILDVLDRADWVDTVSNDLSIFLDHLQVSNLKSRLREEYLQKAEQEFVDGTRDGIELTPDELQAIELSSAGNSFLEVKAALLGKLIPQILLVSKSCILQYKYAINTSDASDVNNLRIAKEIAEKVYHLLPQILEEVQKSIKLGEN